MILNTAIYVESNMKVDIPNSTLQFCVFLLAYTQVPSNNDDCVEVQNIAEGWSFEKQQVLIQLHIQCNLHHVAICIVQEYNTEMLNIIQNDKNQQTLATTKFVVSSTQTSPNDLSFSVNLNGTKPQTVTVKKKASRRCVCQVFSHREGLNCWKITFAFFPDCEHLLDVSTKQHV